MTQHEHRCAACDAEYISLNGINFGLCSNCEYRAVLYILDETKGDDPNDVWIQNSCGEWDLEDGYLHDFIDDIIGMLADTFDKEIDEIDDYARDAIMEIVNNTVPRPKLPPNPLTDWEIFTDKDGNRYNIFTKANGEKIKIAIPPEVKMKETS